MGTSQNTTPIKFNNSIKVGSITFNPETDEKDFELCDELNIMEYYQVSPLYGEGNKDVYLYFSSFMNDINNLCEEDGYVMVRFIVNCKGETDRFRTYFYTKGFQLSEKNIELQRLLKNLAENMGIWNPGKYEGEFYDSYKNICYKIENGKLVEIIS